MAVSVGGKVRKKKVLLCTPQFFLLVNFIFLVLFAFVDGFQLLAVLI